MSQPWTALCLTTSMCLNQLRCYCLLVRIAIDSYLPCSLVYAAGILQCLTAWHCRPQPIFPQWIENYGDDNLLLSILALTPHLKELVVMQDFKANTTMAAVLCSLFSHLQDNCSATKPFQGLHHTGSYFLNAGSPCHQWSICGNGDSTLEWLRKPNSSYSHSHSVMQYHSIDVLDTGSG
ncbi:hypothetical protein EV421DRAFT_1743707 [Armillaria borealis]|uniref:Uncharacterized protein n=1 Tax=Armillaria borealis TaxID=47425 RepID=A0AA39MEH9_9AGAR|nr:hypothetical protein EV421DRAFT_1743707 [Armillaria borealis]